MFARYRNKFSNAEELQELCVQRMCIFSNVDETLEVECWERIVSSASAAWWMWWRRRRGSGEEGDEEEEEGLGLGRRRTRSWGGFFLRGG
jgi:hypothetical protein